MRGFLLVLVLAAWAYAGTSPPAHRVLGTPPVGRDQYECGRELIDAAEAVYYAGAPVTMPKDCPLIAVPWPYELRTTKRGAEVWQALEERLVVTIVNPTAGPKIDFSIKDVRPRACPKPPPGYRVVHSFVQEAG